MTRQWKEGGVKRSGHQDVTMGGGQKLTAGDIDKPYLDSLKQIGKGMQETSSDSERMFLLSLFAAMKQLSPLLSRKPSTKTETFCNSRIPTDNIPKHQLPLRLYLNRVATPK